LLRHITGGADMASFQPMNVNFGLFPPLSPDPGRHADRKPLLARRALADLDVWLARRAESRARQESSASFK
jgi:methylenetetrahydrofolate--tRNA-(uracil-5-)-methyltransferase